MKTLCRTVGSQTYFIISELDLAYYDLVRDLAFSRVEDGFAKVFPTDSPHLDHIYHHFARCTEELILQVASVHPAPWEQALRETINWNGYQLQVPPLDLQLMVSQRRGLTERAEKIKHFMMNNGRHT